MFASITNLAAVSTVGMGVMPLPAPGTDPASQALNDTISVMTSEAKSTLTEVEDDLTLAQTVDQAATDINALLDDMEAVVQQAVDPNLTVAERTALEDELATLVDDLDALVSSTSLNGDQSLTVGDFSSEGLSLDSLSLADSLDAEAALNAINAARNDVGSLQRELDIVLPSIESEFAIAEARYDLLSNVLSADEAAELAGSTSQILAQGLGLESQTNGLSEGAAPLI